MPRSKKQWEEMGPLRVAESFHDGAGIKGRLEKNKQRVTESGTAAVAERRDGRRE